MIMLWLIPIMLMTFCISWHAMLPDSCVVGLLIGMLLR